MSRPSEWSFERLVSPEATFIGRIVAASTRHPLIVVLITLALTGAALVYTARNFALTADTSKLISIKLDWRQHELAFEKAFPQFENNTVVVIDGATPELAEYAEGKLAEALRAMPQLFHSVQRPQGGPFFDRNGILLLPMHDVEATARSLEQAEPMFRGLAADPSLRGVLYALAGVLQSVKKGERKLGDIERGLNALADTFERVLRGQPAWFSWQSLVTGQPADIRERRRVLLVQPVLDYTALEPGQAADDAIRTAARSLELDRAHGIRVRLTGLVPLSDEEFATLAQDWHLVLGAMVAALIGILWLAVRSVRVVIAILITTFLGLLLTAAVGLAAVGRFNLISVAFIPLFVGLGADFAIQFSVRSLAERLIRTSQRRALIATGMNIGPALALSAASIGAGFFAFFPTSYVGVAELGTIAGLGMVVAFVLSIVLLPALLMLMRPSGGGMEEVGFTALAPVDVFVHRRRRLVLGIAMVAAVISAALITQLHFDFDPLNLKSPKVQSMATLRALASDPNWTPNTIDVVAPSLAAAEPLAKRLEALPEVLRTVTINSFVPQQQPEKLALIHQAAAVLKPALDVTPKPAPTDQELQQALGMATALLDEVAGKGTDSAAASARRLGALTQRLLTGRIQVRVAAQDAIVIPLQVMLSQTRELLQAGPVTLQTLPPELVSDWVAKDGRARIQVLPRGNVDDNAALRRFADAILKVAPDATGRPISISFSGDTVVHAFLQAGLYSLVAITLLLALVLRRVRDVLLTLAPVALSGLLTFATCALFDLPMNFTNIIALPLLFGVGVAFNIYFVLAWRAGETDMLQSSLMRAVVFSAMTTATAFGALWLSTHPGTASMGRLLMISLAWELLVTLLVRPALLARPPVEAREAERMPSTEAAGVVAPD
ncbi:MAG: MMPL family transporter [Alphaproteobacteria bacterium]|nr:MMPL family transporter [Alphaproteobacteria bacterium]